MMCKVPTLCCLVLVGLIGFVASQMQIQNIQVLDEGGDDNEMVGAPFLGLGLGGKGYAGNQGYGGGQNYGGHQVSYQDIYKANLHAADGMPTEEPFQIEASEQIVNIAPVGAAKIEVAANTEQKVVSKSLEIESSLSRRKRSTVPYTSKRCIEDILGGGSLLGAANPSVIANNADSVSYDDKIEIGQTKNTLDDNQAEESNLQAIPLNLNKIVIGSARDDYKYYNAFKNFLQPSKSDALIHGRFASNSIESNESSQKSKFNNQKTVSGTPSKISGNVNDEKPNFIQPRCESCNSNRDQNPPQNTNTPSQSQKEQNIESHPLKFKSSPSSIMTTLYDPQLSSSDQMSESHTELSIEDSELSQNKQNLDKASQLMQSNPNQVIDQMQNNIVGNKHHSDSTYNSHNFDELLNQMQSKYQTFHTGMSQLFDSYKSQSGSFQNMMDQQDSHSSHSKHFDFNARCQDQNGVNVDPHLSKMCHLDYRDDVEKSNLTENYQPPLNVAPTNEHKNKFVSFSDYVKMIQNVNRNSGTLLVNHKNGELLGAAVPLTEESEEQPIGHHKQGILNDLRLHIDSFTETDQEATSEPDPQVEAEIDPLVANSEPEETLQINQEDSLRNRFQLFLDKLNTRKKL